MDHVAALPCRSPRGRAALTHAAINTHEAARATLIDEVFARVNVGAQIVARYASRLLNLEYKFSGGTL